MQRGFVHEGMEQGLLQAGAQSKARRSSEKMVDVPPVMLSSALCIHPQSCFALPGRAFTHAIKQSLENDLSKIKSH